jgi:hypothetical protein
MNGSKQSSPGVAVWLMIAAASSVSIIDGVAPFTVAVTFRGVFEDFGAIEELAPLTRFVIRPCFGLAAGLVGLAFTAVAIASRRHRRWSLTFSSLALVISLIALATMIYGLYSPFFAIAEALGP